MRTIRMMKQRIALVVAGMAVATLIAGTALAGMHGKTMQGDKEMSGEMGMNEDKDKPMMQGGMMGDMMRRQVVASSDGGVFIVVGNMLFKYDKDLELVKKTTIEISDEDMQKMMQQMCEHCPMCRKMRQDAMTNKDD